MKPVLQAILLAEHIYQDKWTEKFVIAGTFDVISLGSGEKVLETQKIGDGPLRAPGMSVGSPFVYINLTGLHRKEDFLLRYTDLTTDRVLFEVEISLGSGSVEPLQTVQLALPLPSILPAPHAGTYALELIWDNELLGSHRVIVREGTDPQANPGGES